MLNNRRQRTEKFLHNHSAVLTNLKVGGTNITKTRKKGEGTY